MRTNSIVPYSVHESNSRHGVKLVGSAIEGSAELKNARGVARVLRKNPEQRR